MFKFNDQKCYRMPAFFGGSDYNPVGLYYRDVMGINYTITTDGDRLADYLPQGFELLRPEQNPTQWHVIKALSDLPVIDLAPAYLVKGVAILSPN